MEFTFPWPTSDGEWLAWASAAVAVLLGLVMLVLPRAGLALMRLRPRPDTPEAVAEIRGRVAGFHLGLGIACILLAQPLLYLALGAAWGISAFGRLVAIAFDRGFTGTNLFWLLFEAAMAAMPLAYVLGYVR